ncbi:hypothetical protein SISNIDRAFT_417367 [Sistotremastrum niveocremeum HHB9708]|uniref:Ribosome assembly protein 3 n=1 Tax=Sistotremastrum niveocremeum HHB9708 TaxID=1314777 RepID=A0A164PSI3_9AGAM|nr:hypothetical protein SISNIDRAFT_417367 [Sistotremastrum niveocremeum HHB9708]
MPAQKRANDSTKKRIRKRKRRNEVSSSSSSSSSSSDDSSDENTTVAPKAVAAASAVNDDSSDSESSSSSSSSSSSDDEAESTPPKSKVSEISKPSKKMRSSLSPSPPPHEIPSFLPQQGTAAEKLNKEKELKEKFRKFWMASLVDGFADDLDKIRKEPDITKSRLALLIDSLASGAEVFNSSNSATNVHEMELALDGTT